MRSLGFSEDLIENLKNGKIFISKNKNLIEPNQYIQEIIDEIQERIGLIYYGIYTHSTIGIMYSFLFVPITGLQDWQYDRLDIQCFEKNKYLNAYVYNDSAPYCSEMGSIVLERVDQNILERIF